MRSLWNGVLTPFLLRSWLPVRDVSSVSSSASMMEVSDLNGKNLGE